MEASEKLYNALVEDFGMEGAKGSVRFNLRDFGITVEQNNIISNILEEWLDKWMTSKGIVHIQAEKVATVGKKRVAISKKRVIKSKKRTYRKASARKYSHRELNAIMRILERKFLSEDKTPALRNVVGFGMGSNSIDVALRWNTKEKQLEFRRQIYNSPAIRFEGKLDPIIDNREGMSTYQGISLKAEKPSYPLGTTEIRFTITNHSGEDFVYGDAYSITAQGADGNWFVVPTDCLFTAIGHVLNDGQSGTITAHLFPDILPNKPGVYRFFYEDSIDGEKVPFMATFELK